MRKMLWATLVVASSLAASLIADGNLQAAEAWQEYDKLINNRRTLSVQGPTLFGDTVDLASGKVSFTSTDLSVPGNSSLPVAITRTHQPHSGAGFPDPTPEVIDKHFGDWELELPRIEAVFSTTTGWVNGRSDRAPLRCSVANTGEAGAPKVTVGTSVFLASSYWQGTRIYTPGGSQSMLVARTGVQRPATGGPYYWVTADWTYVSCLPSIQNGTGEGFLAITADGTKYWFNWMAANGEGHLRQKRTTRTGGYDYLYRKRYALLATRVEDRFGNWVSYTYGNAADQPARLARIDSSDGRAITLAYNGAVVSSISDGRNAWNYQYSSGRLAAVILPDASRWSYNLSGLGGPIGYYTGEPGEHYRDCSNPGEVRPPLSPRVGTITHPSGATGEFTQSIVRFRRDVPMSCATGDPNTTNDDVSWYPNVWDANALVKKRVTGPGLAPMEWRYGYEHEVSSTTVVSEPDGTSATYTYGRGFRTDEGKLLRITRRDASGAAVRSEAYTYNLALTGQPYPTPIGDSPQIRSDDFGSEFPRPQLTSTITQDATTFSSEVQKGCAGDASLYCFDAFARTKRMRRFNSIGYSRTDDTVYYDHSALWVLGQVERQTNLNTGRIPARTVFDSVTALPKQGYKFEKLQQTLGYHANGTLHTVTDGRNLTTTLSNWYRGVPQSIRHADGTTESAGVNSVGWIEWAVDEVGSRTCYGYDVMGRLSRITHPSGGQPGACDTSQWAAINIRFEQVQGDEYGIPAGHWRRTEETGAYRKLTYFDGFFQPIVEEDLDTGDTGNTNRWTTRRFDHAGRQVFASYPRNLFQTGWVAWSSVNNGSHTVYDALGRVVRAEQDSEHGRLVTRTAYESNLRTVTTNPRGYQTTNAYMAWDQPAYDTLSWSALPENAVTQIGRDDMAFPLWLQRRNADGSLASTRHYVYDQHMQVCKTVEPETRATAMGYDATGNLSWSASGLELMSPTSCDVSAALNSGRVSSRTYDDRNRLKGLYFPDGRGNQTYTYELDGLVRDITTNNSNGGESVVNAYSYNTRRLLTGESSTQPGWYVWSAGYAYDSVGSLRTMTYPDGLAVSLAPNALGQPTALTSNGGDTFASGVSYYPNGAIRQFTYGNGVVHSMQQNARQLPARVSSTRGVSDYEYGYDANGNVGHAYDHARGSTYSRWMGYDGLDRLTSAGSASFGGDHWHRFTYDPLDNIKSWKLAGVKDYADYSYDLGTQRLTNIRNSAGGTVVGLGYDVQGNLQNKNGQLYQFDFGNRLRGVEGKESYRYDGHGRRVLAWKPSEGSILSMYNHAGQLLHEHSDRTATAGARIYLGGSLIATRDYNWATAQYSVRYHHTDALGSPVAVTDATGTVVDRTAWEPFGAVIGKPQYQGIGYTGHVMDGATGLTYMQQRYYDPSIGRFLSVDPVQANPNTGASFNRYKYASNNPYLFVDPDGRADVVMFQRDEGLAVTANRFDIPNWFTVMGHGGAPAYDPVYKVRDDRLSDRIFTGPRLGANGLVSAIRSSGFDPAKDKGVFLGQCGAGALAADVARQLNKPVMASDGFVFTVPNKTSGSIVYTANSQDDNKGNAMTFNVVLPNGQISAAYSRIEMKPNGSVYGTRATPATGTRIKTEKIK